MLSALLTWPLPLGVAMTANILPLSRRPLYSRRPPPLLLWCIVDSESGQLWLPFHDTGQLLEDPLSSSRTPVQLVTDFVERLQFPIIVRCFINIYRKREELNCFFLSLSLSSRFIMTMTATWNVSFLTVDYIWWSFFRGSVELAILNHSPL